MQRYKILCKRFYDIAEIACDLHSASSMLCNELNSIAKGLGVPTKLNPFTVNEDGGIESNDADLPFVTNNRTICSPV